MNAKKAIAQKIINNYQTSNDIEHITPCTYIACSDCPCRGSRCTIRKIYCLCTLYMDWAGSDAEWDKIIERYRHKRMSLHGHG